MYRIIGVIRDTDLVVSLDLPEGETQPPQLEVQVAPINPDAPAPWRECSLTLEAKGEYEDRLTGRILLGDALLKTSGFAWRLQGPDGPVAPEAVDADGWQVGTLCIPNRKIYNRLMRYKYQRIEDAETLMWVSLVTAHAEEVEIRIRMTSFVVFCYRALELDRVDLLEANLTLFDRFAAQHDTISERYTEGSVREKGEQIVLALLTVEWHALIRLDRHSAAVNVLKTILARGRDNPRYHALPFALNYANAALLLAYLHYRRDVLFVDPGPVQDLYAQFRAMLAALPETIPAFDHLREFEAVAGKMAVASSLEAVMRPATRAKLAAGAAPEALRRRKAYVQGLDTTRMFRLCSRLTESSSFKEAFVRFCDQANLQV